MRPILQTCTPRPEVLKGDLQDALFAADFAHVVEGIAPAVYQDPVVFFQNTYPTATLKKVISTIFERLANPHEAGAAVRLSTGFGGGKTHTLIALWHLARNIGQPPLGTELLPAAGRPSHVVVAGIDARAFGTTVCGTHGDLQTHSLWGELAYQLGHEAGYQHIKDMDDPSNSPDAATVRAILPNEPVLILLDELVIYMAKLADQPQKALLSFLYTLIAEVGARCQAVVVITDPAGQPVYEKEAQLMADATKQLEAAQRLDDILGRKVSDYDPIGTEAPEVISRRLFEYIDRNAAEEVSAEYYNAYQRVRSEYPDVLPPEAATTDYAKRIVRCYPFHPRLLETAQDRLGALQDFNKSRGTLRLFARILRDVWEKQRDVYLITAGDLDWTSERIQADLLQRLNRDNFKAAVSADIVGHAGQLDAEYSTDVHRRVASALLLDSLPLSPAAAMDKRDLTLAVLRPSDVGNEPSEAIDRLMSVCWHTYRDETGTRFQFRYEPNANKIIEERASSISLEDAKQAVLTLAQAYFRGHTFSLIAYPSSPKAVADTAELKLVLSESEALAQAVCDYQDDSNPEAKYPRRFRNAIFGIAPTPSLLNDAVQAMRRLRAAEQIQKEEQAKGKGKTTPLLDEVERLLPNLRRSARFQTLRAFNRLVFQGRPSVTLAEKYLVSQENALTEANGQARLKDCLDDNRLIYQPNEALDVRLLLTELIPGATPSLQHQGAYLASAVHERALAHQRLRLMLDEGPVRNAILEAVKQGKLVVHLPTGEAYDQDGCVTGTPGARTRDKHRQLTTLSLTSDVLLAPASAPCVQEWLRVDERPQPGQSIPLAEAASRKGVTAYKIQEAIDLGKIDAVREKGMLMVVDNERFQSWKPTLPPGPVTVYSWEDAVQHAATRPLQSLKLLTDDQTAADDLVAIAQPFGAKSLRLSVRASGALDGGGQVNFAVVNAKHNDPLKPVDVAKRLLRAAREGTAVFSAELTLDFGGEELRSVQNRLEQARLAAGSKVRMEATFGEEML